MKAGFPPMLGYLLMAVWGSGAVSADPILTIQTSPSTVAPGGSLNLNIDITDVTGLFAFQFDLDFASSVLSATGATEGPFLASGGGHTFFVPGTIGSSGVSSIADTLIGSGPGVSGSGTLASVSVRYSGSSTPVSLTNVLLLDSSLQTIPVTTVSTVVPSVVPEPATVGLAALVLCGFALSRVGFRKARFRWWSLLVALLTTRADAASAGYQFTIIAQPGDTIAGKTLTSVSNPVINNTGTIAFYATYDGGSGIFTPTDLLAQSATSSFRLTDTGVLVFANATSIFTPSQVLVQAGDVIAGKTITDFPLPLFPEAGGPSLPFGISNNGKLVFVADCQPPGTFPNGSQYPCRGVFTKSDLIALAPGYEPVYFSPAINDAGMVVFAASNGVTQTNGIYTPSGPIASAPNAIFDYPVINNSGLVVFWGEGPAGSFIDPVVRAFYPGSGFLPLASIAGHTLCGVLPRPAMNNFGTVVFGAIFENPNEFNLCASNGLFTQSELLIQAGDAIGGKTIASSTFSPGNLLIPSINDAGTIAFLAAFTDGTSGIVMATPSNSGVLGDVNGDGTVDCTDLSIVKASFGKSSGQAGFNPRADVNGDGILDIRDLAFVAQHISAGASCP